MRLKVEQNGPQVSTGSALGCVWIALFNDGPSSGEVCVGPEVDLERFGSAGGLEDCPSGSLVSIRVIEERSFEVTADSFYGDLK